MERKIVLRFRDLATDVGETIKQHRAILTTYGEVWWGWWMRSRETPPRDFFGELLNEIDSRGYTGGFLFDTDIEMLYPCKIAGIKVAPLGNKIATPDPEKTPNYYQGPYPAWFLLKEIAPEVALQTRNLTIESFPTRPDVDDYRALKDTELKSLAVLRSTDATLWVVKDRTVGQSS
jgi:hypothetical protein